MCIEQGFMNNTSNSCFQVIGNKNSISNRKDYFFTRKFLENSN